LNARLAGSLTSFDRPKRAEAGLLKGWPLWALVLGIATALGVFSSFLAYRLTLTVGRDASFWRALVLLNVAYWYIWALFSPAIVWMARRFPFERQRWGRALAVHGVGVTVCSLTHIAAVEAIRYWLFAAHLPPGFSWWMAVERSTLQNFDWEMMTYWAIVGVSQAVFYYGEAQDRRVRQAQLETRLVEAQLQALQQQLHPHFLFNTLHAISTLMHRDVEAADRTLARLSDLLRITLERVGLQEVTLEQELEFLRKYLQIEQTRFQDRLTVRFEVEADALDGLVPNLLLQPLVENSIRHGIGPRSGPGWIEVSARRTGDRLWLEVSDNGAGLSQDAFTALQSGIGLSTTRVRLHHLYGPDYRFEFHRRAPGLTVRIVLPWRPDPTAAAGAA
jgi:signal transduction histidine kinase